MAKATNYTDELRLLRSLLIVTSLQKRQDLKAAKEIQSFETPLQWKPFSNLMIDKDVWRYAIVEKAFDIIDILDDPDVRTDFFNEVFHHALRLV